MADGQTVTKGLPTGSANLSRSASHFVELLILWCSCWSLRIRVIPGCCWLTGWWLAWLGLLGLAGWMAGQAKARIRAETMALWVVDWLSDWLRDDGVFFTAALVFGGSRFGCIAFYILYFIHFFALCYSTSIYLDLCLILCIFLLSFASTK